MFCRVSMGDGRFGRAGPGSRPDSRTSRRIPGRRVSFQGFESARENGTAKVAWLSRRVDCPVALSRSPMRPGVPCVRWSRRPVHRRVIDSNICRFRKLGIRLSATTSFYRRRCICPNRPSVQSIGNAKGKQEPSATSLTGILEGLFELLCKANNKGFCGPNDPLFRPIKCA